MCSSRVCVITHVYVLREWKNKRKENTFEIYSRIVNAFLCVRACVLECVSAFLERKKNENKNKTITLFFCHYYLYQVRVFYFIFISKDNIHIRVSVLISSNSENHDSFCCCCCCLSFLFSSVEFTFSILLFSQLVHCIWCSWFLCLFFLSFMCTHQCVCVRISQ